MVNFNPFSGENSGTIFAAPSPLPAREITYPTPPHTHTLRRRHGPEILQLGMLFFF